MELNLDYLNDARYLHNDFSGHTPFVSNIVKTEFSQNVTKDLVHKGDSVFPGSCFWLYRTCDLANGANFDKATTVRIRISNCRFSGANLLKV